MSLKIVALEPMLRVMGLPPSLARFAPKTHVRPLCTVLLRDSPLVQGLNAEFDDSCFLTFNAGDEATLSVYKLQLHPGKRKFSGVHLGLFGHQGALNIVLGDDQLKLVIGADTVLRGGLHMFGRATVFIGEQTTMGQARILAGLTDVVIGQDCQLSEDCLLLAQEQHTLVDADTGAPLHTGRHQLTLDRHVWVGRRALVTTGVRIGEGAVVAAGAVVNTEVPAHTLVAGSPATVQRERTSWTR